MTLLAAHYRQRQRSIGEFASFRYMQCRRCTRTFQKWLMFVAVGSLHRHPSRRRLRREPSIPGPDHPIQSVRLWSFIPSHNSVSCSAVQSQPFCPSTHRLHPESTAKPSLIHLKLHPDVRHDARKHDRSRQALTLARGRRAGAEEDSARCRGLAAVRAGVRSEGCAGHRE